MKKTETQFPLRLRQAALFVAVMLAFPASADDELFFSEMPIVASVSRLPQQLSETPASVTVIDQEMIRASGMRTVEDLLRLVPGFQVTSHNQDPAIVAYHGLANGLAGEEYGPRVQVLVDGRSQYSPLFKSGVNWNLLPVALENIERIEVIRGSNTVSYGSNAFMGVVNIISIDPALTKGWQVSANHGNNGIRDEMVSWGERIGEANVRMTYRSLQDDGFQQGFYRVNNLDQWTNAPDSRQSQLFDLRVDLPLSARDDLQLTGTFARDMTQYGRPGSPSNDPLRNLEQSSTAFGIQWRRVLSPTDELKLRYAYTEDWAYGRYWREHSITTPSGASAPLRFSYDPGGRSMLHELEVEHRLSFSPATRAAWGAGAKFTELQSYAQFSTSGWQDRFAYRAFGNLEYRPFQSLLFNLGASAEHDSVTGWMFDPRASVSYHVLPGHTLRFSVSRAHRNPSLYETSGRFDRRDAYTGTLDINYLAQGVEPERIDTMEIGYLAELKEYRASLDVRMFSERIPNYIQILPLPLPAGIPDENDRQSTRDNAAFNFATYHYGRADAAVNLENVRVKGYEYQLQWRPFDTTRLIYGSALVCIEAELTDINRVADDRGPNTYKIATQTRDSAPSHSQSAMLIQKLPYGLQASIMYFRASPMRWRRNDPTSIEASERFDWRLAKGFTLGPVRGELAYTVQMANESQQGRTVNRIADRLQWVSLRLNF